MRRLRFRHCPQPRPRRCSGQRQMLTRPQSRQHTWSPPPPRWRRSLSSDAHGLIYRIGSCVAAVCNNRVRCVALHGHGLARTPAGRRCGACVGRRVLIVGDADRFAAARAGDVGFGVGHAPGSAHVGPVLAAVAESEGLSLLPVSLPFSTVLVRPRRSGNSGADVRIPCELRQL